MNRPRFSILRSLALAAAVLLCAATGAHGAGWNLEDARQAFPTANAGDNYVCLLHDGWQIAFLSHNKDDISALLITEQKADTHHQHNLENTLSRLVELISLDTPEKLPLKNEDAESAIVINAEVISQLGNDAEHVFSGNPLEGMAYLLHKEFFYIHGIRPNGYLHWKTVKKSGVELLMPMATHKLSALEVTGRQKMDEYAAQVLAQKLGLGNNTASADQRNAAQTQLNCTRITYMNSKRNIIGAQLNRRFIIGKRNAVAHMLANNYGGNLLYPSQNSDWPEKPEEEIPEQPAEVDKPAPPLTPAEAREAYKRYLQSLTK